MNLANSLLKLLISLLLNFLFVLPGIFVICGVNEVVRTLVKLYLKLSSNNTIKLATASDATFAFTSQSIIRTLLTFDKNYDFQHLKEEAIENIFNLRKPNGELVHEKFGSQFKRKFGYSCWKVDECYKPESHFKELPLDPEMTEERLMALIKKLGEDSMPANKPGWEILFIPQMPNPSECGVILRIHHSYGDGLSLMNILSESISSEDPFPYVIHPVRFEQPRWGKFWLYMKGYAMFGWELLRILLHLPTIKRNRHTIKDPKEINNIRFQLSLSQLKSIQRDSNASITSILMTAAQNAMDKINGSPINFFGMAVVAKLPYPEQQLVNNISFLTVFLPHLDRERGVGSFEQLEKVNERFSILNNSSYVVNSIGTHILGRMPVKVIQTVRACGKGIFIMSNIPFVTKPVELAGGLLTKCSVFTMLFRSLVITTISIGDVVTATIGAGTNLFTPNELVMLVEEIACELKSMEQVL